MAVLHSSRAQHGCGVLNRDLKPTRSSPGSRPPIRAAYLPTERRSPGRTQVQATLLWSPAGRCPCDRCPHAAICCDLQLACRAFAQFVRGVQWGSTVRKPTHKRYLQLFASDTCGAPPC